MDEYTKELSWVEEGEGEGSRIYKIKEQRRAEQRTGRPWFWPRRAG